MSGVLLIINQIDFISSSLCYSPSCTRRRGSFQLNVMSLRHLSSLAVMKPFIDCTSMAQSVKHHCSCQCKERQTKVAILGRVNVISFEEQLLLIYDH